MIDLLLRWVAFVWALKTVPYTFGLTVIDIRDHSCPPLTVDDQKCSDNLSHPLEYSGYDLTETFLLRKGTVKEDLPSFRLGSSPLIKPTKSVFPKGLTSDYSLVSVLRVRRTTKKDRWYLWHVFDQSGETQVSVVVDGDKRVVEFSFQSVLNTTIRYTFKSRELHVLFDRQWHKLSLSVHGEFVSVYVDCKLLERRVSFDKNVVDLSGRTLITTRVEDGRPVDIELKQILIYCDPYVAEIENCDDLLKSKGDLGETGLAGNPGHTGEVGSEGQEAIDREKALKGDLGTVGPFGTNGTRGDVPGIPELPGLQGEKGEKGSAGAPGQPGKEGKRGRRGKPGEPGPRGPPGPPGTSANASEEVFKMLFIT
uniref:Thrombospondin-like N-terminal domain-containing protein n=1 Tax=Nothobranchius furzeri TaxID=105023 RepID=A0A8C6KPB9_NOTFU